MTNHDENIINRIWRIIEQVGICMMTTCFEGGLRARPLEARPDRDENIIWFLTDRRGLKDDEIQAHPEVCLTFVYPKEKVYLSVTGRAFVTTDSCRAKELWNEEQQAWWPGGPADPNSARHAGGAGSGRDVGWSGKLRGRSLRVRKSAINGQKTESRRES